MRELDHPNIIRLLDTWECGPDVYIVSAFLPSDLNWVAANTAQPLPAQLILHMMRQLCLGLAYMHARDLVHCDVKPANILVSDTWHVTIADLGAARRTGRSLCVLPTWWYCPPAMHDGTEPRTAAPWLDTWAVGCIVYELHVRRPLAVEGWTARAVEAGLADEPDARSFTLACLTRRPAATALLQSPYFNLDTHTTWDHWHQQHGLALPAAAALMPIAEPEPARLSFDGV